MNFRNMPEPFGGGDNNDFRRNASTQNNRRRPQADVGRGGLPDIDGLLIVDIVCIALLAIFVIAVIATWKSFSESLFTGFLFPLISACGQILFALLVIAALVIFIRMRFGRYRRW